MSNALLNFSEISLAGTRRSNVVSSCWFSAVADFTFVLVLALVVIWKCPTTTRRHPHHLCILCQHIPFHSLNLQVLQGMHIAIYSSAPTKQCNRSPGGYQRFTSSPPSQNAPLPPQQGYGQNFAQAYPYQPQQQAPLQHQGHMGQMAGPPGVGGVGTPDFGAWGMDGPTAQFGMQLGQSAVAAGQDYVQKNVRLPLSCPDTE